MDTTNRKSSSLPGNSRNDPLSVWVLTDLWTWNGRREGHDINTRLMNLTKGRVKQEIYRRLAQLPEHRRDFAHREIERNMKPFSDLPKERLEPIIPPSWTQWSGTSTGRCWSASMLPAMRRSESWQKTHRPASTL
jgi:hypothetical protein